jgi:hypothetical protein
MPCFKECCFLSVVLVVTLELTISQEVISHTRHSLITVLVLSLPAFDAVASSHSHQIPTTRLMMWLLIVSIEKWHLQDLTRL